MLMVFFVKALLGIWHQINVRESGLERLERGLSKKYLALDLTRKELYVENRFKRSKCLK